MVVIYSQDGIKLYPLLFTACLNWMILESVFTFSAFVSHWRQNFPSPLKDCRVLNGLALCMISKGRWKFPSSHFQPSPEIDGGIFHRHFELQSYTWVFGNLEFIFGNLTKPLSILHFLILLKRCWKFSWLFLSAFENFRNFSWIIVKLQNILPKTTGNRHDLH